MIGQGRIERALVIGYDLFNNLGFYGFEGLKSLASSTYRPFDRERDGLILGEACGAVVLEGRRRAAGDFRFLGGANLCDTYSVTSHDEEGTAVAETMNRALGQAGVEPGAIRAVKAHATGTENNDRTECAAMRVTFGGQHPPRDLRQAVHRPHGGRLRRLRADPVYGVAQGGIHPLDTGLPGEGRGVQPDAPDGEHRGGGGHFHAQLFRVRRQLHHPYPLQRGREDDERALHPQRLRLYRRGERGREPSQGGDCGRYARENFRRVNRFILLTLIGARTVHPGDVPSRRIRPST